MLKDKVARCIFVIGCTAAGIQRGLVNVSGGIPSVLPLRWVVAPVGVPPRTYRGFSYSVQRSFVWTLIRCGEGELMRELSSWLR